MVSFRSGFLSSAPLRFGSGTSAHAPPSPQGTAHAGSTRVQAPIRSSSWLRSIVFFVMHRFVFQIVWDSAGARAVSIFDSRPSFQAPSRTSRPRPLGASSSALTLRVCRSAVFC